MFWFFCIGIVLIISAFALLTDGFGFFTTKPSKTSTSTIIYYGQNSEGSETPTPFQPLPSNTPTPTQTATTTNTPTPTPTNTPTATATNTATSTPLPTNTPPGGIPERTIIFGVNGYSQTYNLSCEARSAVDWAAYYGVKISEIDFQSNLPRSDNPETGFVGYVDDMTGMVPPNSYGVHAPPIATLLGEYGASAAAIKGLSFEELKKLVANGNPVIVWVVGNVWSGTPVKYTSSDGSTTTVAHYEHTVIVIGYDAYNIRVVDGGMSYWRSNEQFLSSFAVLGNMAVIRQ